MFNVTLDVSETLATNCGTDFSNDATVINFKYYCDGLLISVVGCLGLIGNLIAVIVLARPKLRDCFHQLLLALATFDILYITFGGLNYTFKAFEANNEAFTLAFPIIFPFTNITMNATIFMTMAISIERFLGICYPLHLPPHNRKSWFYILPVLILSFVLNIPKFLEGKIHWYPEKSAGTHWYPEDELNHAGDEFDHYEVNRTELDYIYDEEVSVSAPEYQIAYRATELRKNSNYIKFYRTYFKIFSTAVVPFLALIFINLRIIVDLSHVKPKRFGSHRKLWKEMNMFLVLLCIVVTFICCHVPRVVIDIWEFSHVESIVQCNELMRAGEAAHAFLPPKWIECLTHISHFTGILSSSTNFLIYCFIGHNFRKEFLVLLRLRRKMVEGSEAMTTLTTIPTSRKSSCQSHQGGASYNAVAYQPCATNNAAAIYQPSAVNNAIASGVANGVANAVANSVAYQPCLPLNSNH